MFFLRYVRNITNRTSYESPTSSRNPSTHQKPWLFLEVEIPKDKSYEHRRAISWAWLHTRCSQAAPSRAVGSMRCPRWCLAFAYVCIIRHIYSNPTGCYHYVMWYDAASSYEVTWYGMIWHDMTFIMHDMIWFHNLLNCTIQYCNLPCSTSYECSILPCSRLYYKHNVS